FEALTCKTGDFQCMRGPIDPSSQAMYVRERTVDAFSHISTIASQVVEILRQSCKLMEMGGEQGPALVVVVEVMQACKRYCNPVFRRRAPANLIIRRPNPRENLIDDPQFGKFSWYKTSRLSEDRYQSVLAKKGALAAHIGACDEPNPLFFANKTVVVHKSLASFFETDLDRRMSPPNDLVLSRLVQEGPCEALLFSKICKRASNIEFVQYCRIAP
ncbi:MAG: hypothetical protein Q9198_009607, partial [Flavoplaca austrocitrina]